MNPKYPQPRQHQLGSSHYTSKQKWDLQRDFNMFLQFTPKCISNPDRYQIV